MSKRITRLSAAERDGTSQAGRALPALDPSYVHVDERDHAELLAFARAYIEQLRYFDLEDRPSGDWSALLEDGDTTIEELVAYLRDPGRSSGAKARWLGRPHLALLLTFIELLGHARAQLDTLTTRHLEYYYEQVLGVVRRPAVPDRVAILVRLVSTVDQLRVPAGTELLAGKDSAGKVRIYRSERDLYASEAEVAELRSVFVDIERTTLADLSRDRDLSPPETLMAMLELALGVPRLGDPVPNYGQWVVDFTFVLSIGELVDFAQPHEHLFLEHHELRTLMRLRLRRIDADHEWDRINELLGVEDPDDPRDFDANLESVADELNYDGLPQVENIDDLYDHRERDDVTEFIENELQPVSREDFIALMAIKRRSDGEWAEINRLLERAGGRQRGVLSFTLTLEDPTDFDANLIEAHGEAWPPAWPWETADLDGYFDELQGVEAHLAMSAERLQRVVAIAKLAQQEVEPSPAEPHWPELASVLTEAHRERSYAARRGELAGRRAEQDKPADSPAALEDLSRFVLELDDEGSAWSGLRGALAEHLAKSQSDLLDRFHAQLSDPGAARLISWDDAERVLELAWRQRAGFPDPLPQKVEWRNIYPHEDARALIVDPDADTPRWRTFSQQRPIASESEEPAPVLGWALRSPLLALSSGQRTIRLTLGFEAEGFDEARVSEALAAGALIVEVSTAKGWVALPFDGASEGEGHRLVDGAEGEDYWALLGVARELDEDRPALQLSVSADPTLDAFAPTPGQAKSGQEWPSLRVMLRQQWDEGTRSYRSAYEAVETLRLAATHLRVDVDELADLRLRSDARSLDAAQPFLPFGARPAVGARLYLSHPELVRGRLERLSLAIDWMGLPDDLAAHYQNYPGITQASDFEVELALREQNRALSLGQHALFGEGASSHTITIADLPAQLAEADESFDYTPRLDLDSSDDLGQGDLRRARRALVWELTPKDFGHADYTTLASRKSREFAVALSRGQIVDEAEAVEGDTTAADFEVRRPYTPQIKGLRAGYTASLELRFDGAADVGVVGATTLLHVHPFGLSRAGRGVEAGVSRGPRLVPAYDNAGELYVGLRGLSPGQRLSMLVQLVEGSANPDLPRAPVSWSVLEGEGWRSLDDGGVVSDETRGLVNSGIIELDLGLDAGLGQARDGRLPDGLTWLRVTIPRDPDSVCDALELHTQAVMAVFDDSSDPSSDHYLEPLSAGTITRLREPRFEIAELTQPYTSYGARPGERAERLFLRVSERLRHKQRALTPWDYERLVLERFAQIYKAKCLRATPDELDHPSRVRVVVIPDIRRQLPHDPFAPKASASLLVEIEDYLKQLCPEHVEVEVRNPHYVAVMVRLSVRFLAGVDEPWARRQLVEDLNRHLSPWAYDEGAELTINGRIYANSIIEFVERRDYVDFLADLKLFRSLDGENFDLVPDQEPEGYRVTTERPDQILVAARDHQIDPISELGYQQEAFNGINYMKIELDFSVS